MRVHEKKKLMYLNECICDFFFYKNKLVFLVDDMSGLNIIFSYIYTYKLIQKNENKNMYL